MSAAARTLRLARPRFAHGYSKPLRSAAARQRFQSTSAEAAKSGGSAGVVGGIIGGAVVLGLGYTYYHFSGAKTAVNSVSDAKSYVESATKQIKDGSLKPDQTIQWLRSTASQYAALIPGAKPILDQGFQALDEVQEKHGDELHKIISDAQTEIQGLVSKGGLDLETGKKAWDVIVKYLQKIEELAKDVGKDLLEANPQLKEQYGEQLNKLKKLSEEQGGEAKKYADETWGKIKDAVQGGSFDKDKIGQLVQEGMDKVQGFGEEAWKKAMETAKPYLDKNPEVKKLVEDNADKLKQADFGGLVAKLQEAAKSGDVKPLKEFVDKQIQQLQGMGDEAWKGAMARASLYLDNYPEVKKLVEEKADVLKRIDFNEFMEKLREAKRTGDVGPVKEYIEKQAQKLKKQS